MVPGILTPLFLILVLAILGTLVWGVFAAIHGRRALDSFRPFLFVLVAYVLLLAAGSVVDRERRIALGTTLCFDDWCIAVTNVHNATSSRQDRVVTAGVRISSVARGRTQRGSDPKLYFIDDRGTWYAADQSPDDPALRSQVAPGESFTTRVHASIPNQRSIVAVRVWEGAWVDHFLPFDEESPFHAKTYYVLDR
jgi:hypothetical protein